MSISTEMRRANAKKQWANMTPEKRAEMGAKMSAGHQNRKKKPVTQVPALTLVTAANTAAPREPSRDENRKIMDALDLHYETDAERYEGNYSDELLAKELNYPRAWVSKLRESLYGPDRNAAQALANTGIIEQWAKVQEAEDQILKGMELIALCRTNTLELAKKAKIPLDFSLVAA